MAFSVNKTTNTPLSTQINSNSSTAGFCQSKEKNVNNLFESANKIKEKALLILGGLLVSGVVALSIIFAPPIVAGMVVATGFAAFVALAVKSCYLYLNARIGPSTSLLEVNKIPHLPLGEMSAPTNSVVVCKDSVESTQWKLRLLEQAEHTIVISGYAGKQIFDQMLDIIQRKMEDIADFRTYLLISDRFIGNEGNQTRLKKLCQQFPDRFVFVETTEKFLANSQLKLAANHTKAVVIDQGRYCVLGGSGIEDRWTKTAGDTTPKKTEYKPSSWIDSKIAHAFRDMDFVFHSPEEGGFGKTVHIELIKLMTRWKHIMDKEWVPDLYHEIPDRHAAQKQEFPEFDRAKKENVRCQLFATGPEHAQNPFVQELIKKIDEAQNSIYIDHMYFHPPQALLDALARASHRGVTIHLVTNGLGEGSPLAHYVFANRNRHNYFDLMKRGNKDNIYIFEYSIANVTLHKKIIVIDEKLTIGGSGNLGYKSLVSQSDHEFFILLESEEVAQETIDSIKKDMHLSKEIPFDPDKFRAKITFDAALQRFMAPLIG